MDNGLDWTQNFSLWPKLLPNAQIRDVPGTHYKILKEPFVKVLMRVCGRMCVCVCVALLGLVFVFFRSLWRRL